VKHTGCIYIVSRDRPLPIDATDEGSFGGTWNLERDDSAAGKAEEAVRPSECVYIGSRDNSPWLILLTRSFDTDTVRLLVFPDRFVICPLDKFLAQTIGPIDFDSTCGFIVPTLETGAAKDVLLGLIVGLRKERVSGAAVTR